MRQTGKAWLGLGLVREQEEDNRWARARASHGKG